MTDMSDSKPANKLMLKISTRVEDFLTEVADTGPNDLDCLELEKRAVEIVKELGLGLQGERILIGLTLWQTCLEELDQVGLIPSRELSFSVDASLARAFALGEVHRDFAKECDVLGAVVGSDS